MSLLAAKDAPKVNKAYYLPAPLVKDVARVAVELGVTKCRFVEWAITRALAAAWADLDSTSQSIRR